MAKTKYFEIELDQPSRAREVINMREQFNKLMCIFILLLVFLARYYNISLLSTLLLMQKDMEKPYTDNKDFEM